MEFRNPFAESSQQRGQFEHKNIIEKLMDEDAHIK